MPPEPEYHHEYGLLITEKHLDVFGHVNNAADLET